MKPEQRLEAKKGIDNINRIKAQKNRSDKEFELVNYQGDDRVVWVGDIYDEMNMENFKPQKVNSGFGTLDKLLDGFEVGELITIGGYPNCGKCFGKGTRILMYDGSIKNVENIIEGDLIMGNDSTPRKVIGLARGREQMYKVIPNRGEPYIVNESHILSLKFGSTNWIKKRNKRKYNIPADGIVNITVKDYLRKSNGWKGNFKGYRVGVEFPERSLTIDPYFIGLWLGDGHSDDIRITKPDVEIVNYLSEYAKELGGELVTKKNEDITHGIIRCQKFNLQTELFKLGLKHNKHIPSIYKINSRTNRLKLLAGLLDTDGYYHCGGYEYSSKSKKLIEDVIYLSRSLGFSCYYRKDKVINGRTYYHVGIDGNTTEIPIKILRKKAIKSEKPRNVLITGIKLESIGIDNYYGFEVEGDNKLFLLADFTVVHNTPVMLNLIRNFAKYENVQSLLFTYENPIRNLLQRINPQNNPDILSFFTPRTNVERNFEWIYDRVLESKLKHKTTAVFIDHLDFIVNVERGDLVERAIMETVKRIKFDLAVQENLIVFLAAHVKKAMDMNIVPDMNDFKGSSAIEGYSDTVLMVHKVPDSDFGKLKKDSNGEYTYTQCKSAIYNRKSRRMGSGGHVDLIHDIKSKTFKEVDNQHAE